MWDVGQDEVPLKGCDEQECARDRSSGESWAVESRTGADNQNTVSSDWCSLWTW